MYSTNDELPAYPEEGQVGGQWRSEVASRLDHYRARRKKKCAGENSLRLDFEQSGEDLPPQSGIAKAVAERFQSSELTCDTNYYRRVNAEAVAASTAAPEPGPEWGSSATAHNAGSSDAEAAEAFFQASASPEYDPDFDFDRPRAHSAGGPGMRGGLFPDPAATGAPAEPAGLVREDGNLIYFPEPGDEQRRSDGRPGSRKPAIRLPVEPPLAQPPPRGQLAEPVFDPPRILDVPEGIIPTIHGPLFADIRLDSEKPQEDAAVSSAPAPIDLPLQVAMIPQRVFAALIDWLIVLGASAIFMAILCGTLPELPRGRSAHAAWALLPLLFWTIYHHLLLVYAGKTAGMEMANVSLRGFDGQVPSWKMRKRRVYCMLFSLVSLGLGFAWALVDEDCLCWHDRITRTFITRE